MTIHLGKVVLFVCLIGSFIGLASKRCESSQISRLNFAESNLPKGQIHNLSRCKTR